MSNSPRDIQAVSDDPRIGVEPNQFTTPAEQIVADQPTPAGDIDPTMTSRR
jgi:hypothetical protein